MIVLFGLNAQGQIINFPDANFKAKLLSASGSYHVSKNFNDVCFKLDVNDNGEIEVDEAILVKELRVGGQFGAPTNITSLTGIENFINLKILNCSYSLLSNSDSFTSLINLEELWCSDTSLTSLDVSSLSNLKTLNCFKNQLTSITVNGLSNLIWLDCSYNQLPSLDVSGLISLTHLKFRYNQISSIDVTSLTNLGVLECSNNLLTSLDMSNSGNIQILYCQNNLLTSLNLNGVSSILGFIYLNCSNNKFTSLDLSSINDISSFNCSNNQFLEFIILKNGINNDYNVDFSNCPNLSYICQDEYFVYQTQSLINQYGYTNCTVNPYCTFEPGGNYYLLNGSSKLDSNLNGCDILDIAFPFLKFNITGGVDVGNYIVNATGVFSIPLHSGAHTITTTLENPTYFNISPTNITVDFPTQASPFVQDFCVTANGVHHDVEVVILPTVPARPGFDAKYKIIYRNKGNQVESGAVTFTYNDAVLDYVSANPVYDSQATDSFVWNYANLEPFETREIEVILNINSPMETPAVNNDDILNYTAIISPANTDETINDNTFALNQTVVGSYDPNDKTCLEGKTVSPDMIGEYVHYVIRFENTGTFPAENVVVKDMIDLAKFDIATLIPLKGSHDFYTRIKDNKVEFIFENINLDFNDATNDGYVAFKIKTKSTLVVGDTFSNDANIYFDYNFPITTNTYTTTIQTLSSQDFDFANQFTLYPNPVNDILNFNSKENLEIQSAEVYNMLGQIVISVPNATKSINVSSLTKGSYFVKVNTEKGSATSKFVKE